MEGEETRGQSCFCQLKKNSKQESFIKDYPYSIMKLAHRKEKRYLSWFIWKGKAKYCVWRVLNWVLSSNSEEKKLGSSITTSNTAICLTSGFRSEDGKVGRLMRFTFDRGFAFAPLRALSHSNPQHAGPRPPFSGLCTKMPGPPQPSKLVHPYLMTWSYVLCFS